MTVAVNSKKQLPTAVSNREKAPKNAAAWHTLHAVEVLSQLATTPKEGLSKEEIRARFAEYGPNELQKRGGVSPWKILLQQFTSTMVVLLIVAAIASAFLGDIKDMIAILAIIVLNALLGFYQEYKAERAIEALRRMAVPFVHTRRSGHMASVSANELVPGDIVLLEAGSSIPADCRLVESANLQVQEAALTGESQPIEKNATSVHDQKEALADRRNMIYMGSNVSYGRAIAVVTETGMRTELGRIAIMLQDVVHQPTPLQQRLNQLGHTLAIAALAIVSVVFFIGILRGEPLELMFLTAVSLAVAAVPEGLPAVVTIALALGAQRMLRKNALIRRLPAVETLGSVTTICSDKTGTLTKNEMAVSFVDVANQRLDVRSSSAAVNGFPMSVLLAGGALCNDAEVDDSTGTDVLVGDPTEAAIVAIARKYGVDKRALEDALPRIDELPFDSDRKRMTTLHRCQSIGQLRSICPNSQSSAFSALDDVHSISFTKGAVDSLLEVSSFLLVGDDATELTDEWLKRIRSAHDDLAGKGMRVLGVGFRVWDDETPATIHAELERELIFIGLVAMIDPPRDEAAAAIETCRAAGIRPIMITGDHPITAEYIAHQLGFDDLVGATTGKQLDELSAAELNETARKVSVYARVTPEHKLKLVRSLQGQGHIVAMTGDGVNDAPALKQADIGVAMGITGTDVTKETSDMILRDDNFATIVAAIEQGRVIFDNIRKFIRYLLSANVGEIFVMLLGPLMGMPMPLLPLQILWMNLVTDGLPALALGVEKAERDVMQRPPFRPDQSVFSRGLGFDIAWIGMLMGTISLAVGYYFWWQSNPAWQTILFTTLTLSQLSLALAVRSETSTVFELGLFSNKAMLAAVILTFLLQLPVIYFAPIQLIFDTQSLTLTEFGVCVGLSLIPFIVLETRKVIANA